MTTYVSLDIETLGHVPGLNSMISLAGVAFRDGEEIASFTRNIQELEGCVRDESTMNFWKLNEEALKVATNCPIPALEAMEQFTQWVKSLPTPRAAVAWPAIYDFPFVNYYCHRFTGNNPLALSAVDIRSLAMGITGSENYRGFNESDLYDLTSLTNENPFPHVALNDAREQGRLFCALQHLSREVERSWRGKLYPEGSDIEAEKIADILAFEELPTSRLGKLFYGDLKFQKLITNSTFVQEPIVADSKRFACTIHIRKKGDEYVVIEEKTRSGSDKTSFHKNAESFGMDLEKARNFAQKLARDNRPRPIVDEFDHY